MDTDKLLTQYESYVKIFRKYFDETKVDKFLDDFGTRLVTCPRGLILDEGGSYGDLVHFSSQVAISSKNFSKGLCDPKSAVRVSLVHELGKLGSLEEELFLSQDSQWHREKLGQHFKYNEKCPKMSAAHRTLYLLQKYGLEVSQEEWIAILTSQGLHFPENGFYGKNKSVLTAVLHFARSVVNSSE